ncbi:unnamed protein product [Ixodes hexagonus]
MRGDSLPPELQLIAKKELGETEQGKHEALDKLNRLLDDELELRSRRDDEFLLRFLRVRKYNVDTAFRKVKEYYRIRRDCPSVFENFVPSSAKLAARNMMIMLPQRDIHGRPVLLLRAGAWNPHLVSLAEGIRTLVLIAEHLTADPVAQTIGVSCIEDYDGLTVDKLVSLNFGLLKRFLRHFLDCMPVRVKAVHVVRESYAFDMAYAVLRPFISKKITDRIRFHGWNFDGLHEEIPVDLLPKEYGGLGPDVDFEAYWRNLDNAEALFVENNRYGYHEKESCGEEIEVTAF